MHSNVKRRSDLICFNQIVVVLGCPLPSSMSFVLPKAAKKRETKAPWSHLSQTVNAGLTYALFYFVGFWVIDADHNFAME